MITLSARHFIVRGKILLSIDYNIHNKRKKKNGSSHSSIYIIKEKRRMAQAILR